MIGYKEEKFGIDWCVNCVGWHPDHVPGFQDYHTRMKDPQKDAFVILAKYKDKLDLYRNKSCVLCGRTYDHKGDLDQTWKLTAKRVKMELQNAGIFGTDDKKVELVVARCRKSVEFLFKNRFHINPKYWERFTFAGCLVTIITHAQVARNSKLGTEDQFKGPVR